MGAKPLHPLEFIIELLGPDGIAIGKIERRNDETLNFGFDVPAV